jgi:hypothetical protein
MCCVPKLTRLSKLLRQGGKSRIELWTRPPQLTFLTLPKRLKHRPVDTWDEFQFFFLFLSPGLRSCLPRSFLASFHCVDGCSVAPYGTVWHRETLCLDWGSISAGRAVGYGQSFEKSLGSVFRRWIVSSLSYVEVVIWAGFKPSVTPPNGGRRV